MEPLHTHDDEDFESPVERPEKTRRRPPVTSLVVGSVIGVAIALAAAVIYLKVTAPDTPAELTDEELQAAQRRWETHGPRDYQMTVVVSNPDRVSYRLTVRDGAVMQFERGDGFTPRRHVGESWTVAALLDIIYSELHECERIFRDKTSADVIQQAEFDPELGYPRRYRRIVLGDDSEVEWEITEFKTLPSDSP